MVQRSAHVPAFQRCLQLWVGLLCTVLCEERLWKSLVQNLFWCCILFARLAGLATQQAQETSVRCDKWEAVWCGDLFKQVWWCPSLSWCLSLLSMASVFGSAAVQVGLCAMDRWSGDGKTLVWLRRKHPAGPQCVGRLLIWGGTEAADGL